MKLKATSLFAPIAFSSLTAWICTLSPTVAADSTHIPAICYFTFYRLAPCTIQLEGPITTLEKQANLQNIAYQFETKDDVHSITSISITSADDWSQEIALNKAIEVTPGSRGLLLYQDINFDHHPDIALQTSFGLANWYFDYWTYSPESKQFEYVGHFPKLNLDLDKKQLTAKRKVNAKDTEKVTYEWNGKKLIEKGVTPVVAEGQL